MAAAVLMESPLSTALAALLERAAPRSLVPGAYAGEVTTREAYEYLQQHPEGLLVDVRTQPEWQFTGTPDLSSAQGKFVAVSWKTYPSFVNNPQFFEQLEAQGVSPHAPVFFLCRSGGRSLDAAIAATSQGYAHAFNVIGGFEGEPDGQRHRGTQEGWKAAGLPWGQA